MRLLVNFASSLIPVVRSLIPITPTMNETDRHCSGINFAKITLRPLVGTMNSRFNCLSFLTVTGKKGCRMCNTYHTGCSILFVGDQWSNVVINIGMPPVPQTTSLLERGNVLSVLRYGQGNLVRYNQQSVSVLILVSGSINTGFGKSFCARSASFPIFPWISIVHGDARHQR